MPGRATQLRVGGVLALGTLLLGAWYLGSDRENPGVTHIHYLAADEVDWDYAPSGRDLTMGRALDSAEFDIGNGPLVMLASFARRFTGNTPTAALRSRGRLLGSTLAYWDRCWGRTWATPFVSCSETMHGIRSVCTRMGVLRQERRGGAL
jgi:hypothetical protein